jgi:hypothetical protein
MGATMIPAQAEPDVSVLAGGPEPAALEARLTEGADRLADGRRSIQGHPQLLIAAAATLMTAGIAALIIGWSGASRSTYVEEQIPYLISGGLMGVALSTIGALLFFTHWLTISIKEARAQELSRRADHEELMAARRCDHEELLAALRALTDARTPKGDTDGNPRGDRPARPVRRPARRS